MREKHYLVRNITVNNNKQFEVNVPIVYCENAVVSHCYLRTIAMKDYEVLFEAVELVKYPMTTYNEQAQPYDCNITDISYTELGGYELCDVIPMPMSSVTVTLDMDDVDSLYDGDINVAVYEKLLAELPVDFLIFKK